MSFTTPTKDLKVKDKLKPKNGDGSDSRNGERAKPEFTGKVETVCNYLQIVSDELKELLYRKEGILEPELIIGLSEILDIQHVEKVKQLAGSLAWHMCYSTSLDKRELSKLYEKLGHYEGLNQNASFLLILKDTSRTMFGILYLESFNETQPTCLILLHRDTTTEFECPALHCVFKRNLDSFYIGYKDGSSGIWLNEKLSEGTVHEIDENVGCSNGTAAFLQDPVKPPKIKESKFKIKSLECWTFSLPKK